MPSAPETRPLPDDLISSPGTVAPPAAQQPPASAPPRGNRRRRFAAAAMGSPLAALLIIWAIVFVYFAATQEKFLTEGNITNMVQENSIVFVIAIAETMIVLMGGIDLSSGGLLALTGLILTLGNHGSPEWVAILATIAAAAAIGGLINGIPIGIARMNPFVVTLGSLTIFRGLANVTTDGNTYVLSEASIVTQLATGKVASIPVPAFVMLVVFALFFVLLRYTYFGRDIYAIGGNQEAATLAGVRVRRVRVIAYVLLGLVVGLAAVMQAGRLSSVSPTAGQGLELLAVATVLLGGTRLSGGRGGVVGTAAAVLFLATVDNGLRISGVSSFWEDVVTGTVLIVAVGFEQLRGYLVETRRPAKRSTPVSP